MDKNKRSAVSSKSQNRRQFIHNSLALAAGGLGLSIPGACLVSCKTPSIAERVRKLHRENVVFVVHDHNPIAPDVHRMLAGGVTGKCYQLGADVEISGEYKASAQIREGWAEKTMQSLEEAESVIKSDPKHLILATTAEDILQAKRDGKIAIMFGVEGGKLLEGKLEWLQTFYEHGLRELQLTWAVPNQIVERSGTSGDGLTSFGRDVVRECNNLGIIIDLTHIRKQAFYEVIELTKKPIILSHEALGRGVGESELKALASNGGIIGIHFYTTYLGENPTPDKVVDQMDRIVSTVGIDAVALGCDFFPNTGAWAEMQYAQGAKNLAWAINDIGQLDKVTEAMITRNFSENDIIKVLGGNFLRVCRDVFGK
jgi:membrane dipeptidase